MPNFKYQIELSTFQIGFGALCGLCMPFIIPKIVLFKMKEPTKSDNPKVKSFVVEITVYLMKVTLNPFLIVNT